MVIRCCRITLQGRFIDPDVHTDTENGQNQAVYTSSDHSLMLCDKRNENEYVVLFIFPKLSLDAERVKLMCHMIMMCMMIPRVFAL